MSNMSFQHSVGGILSKAITNKKDKNENMWDKINHKKDNCYSLRAETRRQGLVGPQLGTSVQGDSSFFLLCTYSQMDLGGTSIDFWGDRYISVSRQIHQYGILKDYQKSTRIDYKESIRIDYICLPHYIVSL